MEFVVIKSYNQENVASHLISPSGYYENKQGTALTVGDLTSKEAYMQMIKDGEIASTTAPHLATRALNYKGLNEPGKKGPEFTDNFDHIVIEGIPSTADIQKYQAIIKEQLENTDIFYLDDKRPQLIIGNREVFSRIDTNASGNNHIHFFVNRHSVVDKETLQKKLTTVDSDRKIQDNEKAEAKEAINKALGFMTIAGKDKALAQSADFGKSNYLQSKLTMQINDALIANGLAPLPQIGSYPTGSNSNQKSSVESQRLVNAVANEGYKEEVIEKIIENINSTELTSLDSVVIQKRLNENNDRAKQLADELRKVNAESRQLAEAQNAINQVAILTRDNQALNTQLSELKQNVTDLQEKFKSDIQSKEAEIEVVKESYEDKLNQKEATINIKNMELTEVKAEKETLDEEYNRLQSETQEQIAQANLKNEQLQAENESEREKNSKLQNDLKDEQNKSAKLEAEVDRYNGLFETLTEQFKNQAKQLEAQQKTIDAQAEFLEKQKAEFDATIKKQQAELQAIIDSKDADNKALKVAVDETAMKVVELDATNQALTAQNSTLQADNARLTTDYNTLAEVATRLATFADKVKTTFDKVVTATKGFVKVAPALKAQVADITKDHATVTKEGKQLTEAQKRMQQIIKDREAAAKLAQEGSGTTPGTDNQVKPK